MGTSRGDRGGAESVVLSFFLGSSSSDLVTCKPIPQRSKLRPKHQRMRVLCMAGRSCLATSRETRKKRIGAWRSAYRRLAFGVSAFGRRSAPAPTVTEESRTETTEGTEEVL